MRLLQLLRFTFLGLFGTTCNQTGTTGLAPTANNTSIPALPSAVSDFNGYWYAGKAEISTYLMEQERYGEIRDAKQVNVFVTEDLSGSKQVKLDDPTAAGKDRVPVLKLNTVRRFNTGIYDYSLMSSVFTPVQPSGEASLKYTATVQDWCGHTFTQINRLDKAWRWRQFSYFEKEADTDFNLNDCILEDEIFTHLRLNPDAYADKRVSLLPGEFYLRMRHLPTESHKASITSVIENGQRITRITYDSLPRQIRIVQEPQFPHRILEWEEMDGGKRFAYARLYKIMMSDYWSKNSNAYSNLRRELGLD